MAVERRITKRNVLGHILEYEVYVDGVLVTKDYRYCNVCKEIQVKENFHKGASYCKPCANRKSRESHARRMVEDPTYTHSKRDQHKKVAWGMSVAEYDAKWQTQKVCAICGEELQGGKQTHLDHCHSTGRTRDFLCSNCNRGLGSMRDNILFLEAAIKYLRKHNDSVDIIKEGS